MGEENPFDRGASETVPDVLHGTDDPSVSPARILARHRDDQSAKVDALGGSARSSRFAAIVLRGDEVSVPTQDGVWRGDGSDRSECRAPERLSLVSEQSPLRVGEPQPFAAELLPEHVVLRSQVIDRGQLPPVDPARNGQQQEVQSRGFHDAKRPTTRASTPPIFPRKLRSPNFGTTRRRVLARAVATPGRPRS